MKWKLNLSIFLLSVALIFLILDRVALTGAIIGTNKTLDFVYFLLIFILGSSLVLLMSFRKWALGGLAALVLAGGTYKAIDSGNRNFSDYEGKKNQQVQTLAEKEFGKEKASHIKAVVEPSALKYHGKDALEYGVQGLEHEGRNTTIFYSDREGKLIGLELHDTQGNHKFKRIENPEELKKYEDEFHKVVRINKSLYGSRDYFGALGRSERAEKSLLPK